MFFINIIVDPQLSPSLIFWTHCVLGVWQSWTTSCAAHDSYDTMVAHLCVGFVLSPHQCSFIVWTKIETFLIRLHKHLQFSGLDPSSFTASMLWMLMPRGMSGQLVGLLSNTMTHWTFGTSHSMCWKVKMDVGGESSGCHSSRAETIALQAKYNTQFGTLVHGYVP